MMQQGNMAKIWKIHRLDLLAILLLFLTLPLFFYKLGQSSLVSWDEAWYGEIARNILKNNDFLHLTFNGNPYTDHPPFGFWLIAISFKLFGVNEFWTRFAPALVGFLGVLLTYFLGKQLFNRHVGLLSAVALASSPWFVYRARSGNLDSILTTFFVLTVLFAIKSKENKNFLIPLSLSLSVLILTKTLVPFTVFPALIVIFWGTRLKGKDFTFPLIISLTAVMGWFFSQYVYKSDFFSHYFKIGFPGAEVKTPYLDNLKLVKEYLHNGIGKWFWPGISGVFAWLFLRQRRFLLLSTFFLVFTTPFLFSNKGHIWHLLPLHPFMILAFFGFSYVILAKTIKNIMIINIIIFVFGLYFSLLQIRQIWYQFIDIPRYISDEAILSGEAGKYSEDFYIDGGDFGPAAVFYSGGKRVSKVWEGGLPELFKTPKRFVLITHQWRLDKYNIEKSKYKILKSDRDKILIIKR